MILRQIRFYGSKSKKQSVVDDYLKRQASDYYSRLAKEHNYRARSAFKLLAINEKHKVIHPGDIVVDIGAAPGSWSQVAAELVFGEGSQGITSGRPIPPNSRKGYVLGVDIQPISSLPNIEFIGNGDITRRTTHERIRKKLAGRTVNAIISDMAPNPTGDHYTDHLRIIELCRLVFRLAFIQDNVDCPPVLPLAPNGRFLCKVFDGQLTTDFAAELGTKFKSVQIVKPLASRETSSEKYLLAKDIR